MKVLVLIFLLLSLSAVAEPIRCGGVCEGTSNNTSYNNTCLASSMRGANFCEQLGHLGCVWTQRRKIPGRCVGTSSNQAYNNTCAASTMRGANFCEQLAHLGCSWDPGYCI